MTSKTGILLPAAFFAVLVLLAAPAYAYIDPGTGSMLVQAIAAAVLTAGAVLGVFWRAVKNFFLGFCKHAKADAAAPDQSSSDDLRHQS